MSSPFRAAGRDLDEDQRRAAFQAHHFQGHARDRLLARPGLHQLDRLVHVAVRLPVLVEHRRLVGDADVFDQLRDDFVIPQTGNETVDLGGVHGFSSALVNTPILRPRMWAVVEADVG